MSRGGLFDLRGVTVVLEAGRPVWQTAIASVAVKSNVPTVPPFSLTPCIRYVRLTFRIEIPIPIAIPSADIAITEASNTYRAVNRRAPPIVSFLSSLHILSRRPLYLG